jgi:L-histidine N-alpha-methyltransferase
MNKQFLEDVKTGLSGNPKSLSSKYFYDSEGDRLFQQIMELKDYYLTDCEYEIFSEYKHQLLDHFTGSCEKFHLMEFGAGDAFKTRVLIKYFLEKQAGFEYNPIDISENVILNLVQDLNGEFPELQIEPINLEYFDAVEEISLKDTCKKVILFLGSNIGNFKMEEAQQFFSRLGTMLQTGDQLLTGFDLQKDPGTILAAYNDTEGITAEFNMNLLRRINRELDADFRLESFYHYPLYDPETGAAKSYLISQEKQEVNIGAIPLRITFEKAEPIYMEISQKYSLEDIRKFADRSGFVLIQNFLDRREYFVNSLWEKKD